MRSDIELDEIKCIKKIQQKHFPNSLMVVRLFSMKFFSMKLSDHSSQLRCGLKGSNIRPRKLIGFPRFDTRPIVHVSQGGGMIVSIIHGV